MPRPLSDIEVADFRDRLCDSATVLIARRGAEGFTLREVAAELGVSPMTPYRYFKDKDDILAAVRARAFRKFSEALEEAVRQPGDAPSRARAAGEAYIRFALENPTAYKLMFDLSQNDKDYPELAEAGARASLTLTRHVHPLVDQGLLEGDPNLIAHIFWATLHGAVMLRFAGKLGCDFRMLIDEAFRALVEGFRPKRI